MRPLQSGGGILGMASLPQRCCKCLGFWVNLASIGALQQSGALESVDDEAAQPEGDRRTGLCPEGLGLLLRAKASWTRPFFVERCGSCSGIWLDAGEWKRLSAEHLLEHLEDLWLPTWRKQMQAEYSAAQLEDMLRQRLGPALLDRLDALADEIASHEHGDLAFAVLQERFSGRRPRRSKP
jgi:Zn-finger nucleic acid-binding protein